MSVNPTADHALRGRVALVTGGATGIGAATARALAAAGASVAVNHRGSEDAVAPLLAELREHGSTATATAVRADVTVPEEVDRMVAAVESELGPVDVLVLNAAGVGVSSVSRAPFAKTDWADVERVVTAQLAAVFHPAQAVLPGMAARGDGRVVVISAAMAGRAAPGLYPVGLAKSTVQSAVMTLAAEYGPEGVRVNAVAPGLVVEKGSRSVPERVSEANAKRSALRRNCSPEDVARVVAFLASDHADYLTGCHLVADGGTSTH